MQDQIQALRAQGYDPDQILLALANQAEKVQKVARGRREELEAARQETEALKTRLKQLEDGFKSSRSEAVKAKISPITDSLIGKLKAFSTPKPAQSQPAPAQTADAPAPQAGYVPITYQAAQINKVMQGGRPVQVATTVARTMNVPADVRPGSLAYLALPPEVKRQVLLRHQNARKAQAPR